MSRYTHAEMRSIVKPIATKLAEGISEGLMQYLSEADLDLGKAKAKQAKEDFVGQAKLVNALKVHYADFHASSLAKASRKRTATPKNPKGRCGYYALVMTWAIQNKNAEAKAWCEAKGSSKAIQKWYKAL